MHDETITLSTLLEKNKDFVYQFKHNPLMLLIESSAMNESKNRTKLLDCIQVFSNYFQKTVMMRAILNEDKRYQSIVRAHLKEEFGHDVSLMHDRHNRAPIWDPILEACSGWFVLKMLTLDNIEKTLLVHLVLEASANVFFVEAHRVMARYDETNYFKIHAQLDEQHEAMGIKRLEGLSTADYAQLLIIQSQGWDMLNAACERIAALTQNQDEMS